MPKTTNAARQWQEIDARIQFFGPNELRQFFAASAKFLIDDRHWDDPRPATPFDGEPVVEAFHSGFEQFKRADMLGETTPEDAELLDVIRRASDWDRKRLNRRRATKRLTRLRRRLQQRLVRHRSGRDPRPLRGFRFYDRVLRRKYLGRPGAAE